MPRHSRARRLAKPIGSGPYVVADIDAGKSVTFKRDPNYWGRDLPINRGLWNFDELRFDFYRDGNAYFEAFKAGLYDVRSETDPGRWQTGYDFPAVRDGRVVKDLFPSGLPKFASDFVFNTRRPIFADIRVREAIALLFDFRVGQSQSFLRSLSAQRELFRRLGIVRLSPAGGRARARAAGALPRRGTARRARRHLVAAGQRRLRPRPRDFAASARAVSRRRLRARRHDVARSHHASPLSASRSWSPARTRSGSR